MDGFISKEGRMQLSGLSSVSPLTNSLNRTNDQLQKILQKLATGRSINQASDDAAGLAMSQELETQVRGYKMASENVDEADSAMNIAGGVAGQSSDILQRQRDLALQASNGTLNDGDRQAIDAEYQQLTQQLDQQANGAQYNTQNVANGTGLSSGNAQIQASPNAGGAVTAPQVNITAQALGITGTSVATAGQAQSAIGAIDKALNSLNTQQSTVGAFTNRLGYESDDLNTEMVNSQSAESVISDEDMAQGSTDFATQQLLTQTSTAAFAMFNKISAEHIMGLLG
jgi:flagellin